MRYTLIAVLAIALVVIVTAGMGCQNLKKKTFRVVSHTDGEVIATAVDPTTMTLLPKIYFGSSYTSITTIPENIDELDCEVTTYSFWTGKKMVTEKLRIRNGKVKDGN